MKWRIHPPTRAGSMPHPWCSVLSNEEMGVPAGADEFAELLAARLDPEEMAKAIVWLATIPGCHLAEALRRVA
jgi:hypothetical protein